MLKDLSLTSATAGFVAVLVGFTSSAVIVFQAADAAAQHRHRSVTTRSASRR